jgi:RNA polymerase sigma-70 factor (ECF subfamily)
VKALQKRDRRLARRLLAGDERAFQEFFDSSFPGLYRFALVRLGHDAAAAEEVAQATLCAAIRKLGSYRGEAALFTWLCTFCRHEIAAHYRRIGREGPRLAPAEESPEIMGALDTLWNLAEENPEELFRRREMARFVQVTLDRLPRHYGDALEWKYIEDLPVREIAARLGLSPKAAESLLTRARQAFRDGFAVLVRTPVSWQAAARGTS